MGQEERFPPTRLSAGCGFRKETIAGTHGNGQDAPNFSRSRDRDGTTGVDPTRRLATVGNLYAMARCRHEASALREVTPGGTRPLATRTTTAVLARPSALASGQNPARFDSRCGGRRMRRSSPQRGRTPWLFRSAFHADVRWK